MTKLKIAKPFIKSAEKRSMVWRYFYIFIQIYCLPLLKTNVRQKNTFLEEG